MAERKAGNRKGAKATTKQKESLSSGRKKADEARAARAAARKEARLAKQEKPRWQKLEEGELSIKDLTLEELTRGQVANNDGSWEGRRHVFSPAWQQKMATEFRRKFRRDFDMLAPLAMEAMEEILQDEDSPAQRWAAAKTMIEYQMGKVPEVVHIGAESEFDRLAQTGFVILRGEENIDWSDDDDDNTGEEPVVVRGELG